MKFREELPQVYSSRAGIIGYIFATWMREEINLNQEITKNNERIETVMLQLQKDHHRNFGFHLTTSTTLVPD